MLRAAADRVARRHHEQGQADACSRRRASTPRYLPPREAASPAMGCARQLAVLLSPPACRHCWSRLEPDALVEAQRQVQVLHAGAAGALAEVVQPRRQPDSALALVAKDEELQAVGVVQHVRAQEGAALQGVSVVQRHHGHEQGTLVVLRDGVVQVGHRGAGLQLRLAQRHRDDHALLEVAHRWAEDRLRRQSCALLHLWGVLVVEAEAVGAPWLVLPALIDIDQALATAGVAAHSVDHDVGLGRHQARVHERLHKPDEARGIAAGVGDALGPLDGLALLLGHLGEAVGPAVGDAVRGAGVDDDRVRVAH
mmetsp:Transcript_7689/g.10050  ORF Transcript_7689/g.10050 Transcript_7689/m.10050 type:complete len:310 (+) Transcript_7689:352-1281(+)